MDPIFCKKFEYVIVYPDIESLPADGEYSSITGRGELTIGQDSDQDSGTLFYTQTFDFRFEADQLSDINVFNQQHVFIKVMDSNGQTFQIGTIDPNYNPFQVQTIRKEKDIFYLSLFRQSENIDF
jgi:hypothetical protein